MRSLEIKRSRYVRDLLNCPSCIDAANDSYGLVIEYYNVYFVNIMYLLLQSINGTVMDKGLSHK